MTDMIPISNKSAMVTLTGVREAHSKLFERQSSGTSSLAEMVGDVYTFIDLACRSGAVLYLSEDRQFVQALIDYWSSVMFRVDRDLGENTLEAFAPDRLPILKTQQPYVGLEAFDEDSAPYFFGRDALIEAMLKKLRDGDRFLAAVGPSGSGKSSLILAGLIPALKQGGVEGSTSWHYLGPIVPGSDPMVVLGPLVTRSTESTDRVNCLIVDQFEEVFTLCADQNQRARFVQTLVDLAKRGSTPHRVILTMRSDFVDLVMRYPELHELFVLHEMRVGPLAREELRAAITKPAEKVKLEFDPGLVEMIVNDSAGERTILPLLQVTLLELWRSRRGNRLTRERYRELVNPRLALYHVAEKHFGEFEDDEKKMARRIFLRIVHPTEGLEFTRKRVARIDLASGERDIALFDRVLAKLRAAGLVRYTEVVPIEQSKVEIPHEALVSNWPRLRAWIEEKREDIAFRDRLEIAAYNWAYLERNGGWLNDTHVAEARRWMSTAVAKDLGCSNLVRQFVDASEYEVRRNQRRDRVRLWLYILLPVVIVSAVAVNLIERAMKKEQAAEFHAEIVKADAAKNAAIRERELYLQKKEAELADEIRTKRVKAMESERDNLQLQVMQITAVMAETMQRLIKATADNTTAQTDIRKLQSDLDDLKDQFEKKKAELAATEDKLKDARTENNDLKEFVKRASAAAAADTQSMELPPEKESPRIGGPIELARQNATTGSICCVVRTSHGERLLLTMRSILPGKPGDLVAQPSRGGAKRERIAVVWRVGDNALTSGVLALPLDGVVADRSIPDYGRFRGTEDNIKSQPHARIVGAGTGESDGRMLRKEDGMIVTDIPATAKDIGAPLFNHSVELVGIVAKVENGKALALPIDPILEELHVRIDR